MAIACDASSIAEAAKCFQNPCINENDRTAIVVLLKAYQLVTAGGTDYTTDFDALMQASVNFQVIGHNVPSAEDVALELDATTGSPTTVNDLLEAVKCLRCQSLEALRQALQLLKCLTTAEG